MMAFKTITILLIAAQSVCYSAGPRCHTFSVRILPDSLRPSQTAHAPSEVEGLQERLGATVAGIQPGPQDKATPPEPIRVLIVCRHNQERSPLVAAILAGDLPDDLKRRGVVITSAGLRAAHHYEDWLEGLGANSVLASHVARILTADIVQQQDLILVAEKSQIKEITIGRYDPAVRTHFGGFKRIIEERGIQVDTVLEGRDLDVMPADDFRAEYRFSRLIARRTATYTELTRTIRENLDRMYDIIRQCALAKDDPSSSDSAGTIRSSAPVTPDSLPETPASLPATPAPVPATPAPVPATPAVLLPGQSVIIKALLASA